MKLTIDFALPRNTWEPLAAPQHYDIAPDSLCYPGGMWVKFKTTDGYDIAIHHSVVERVTVR